MVCVVIPVPAFWPVQVIWGKCHMLTVFYDGPRPVAQCFSPGSLTWHEGEWKLRCLTLAPSHFVLPTYDLMSLHSTGKWLPQQIFWVTWWYNSDGVITHQNYWKLQILLWYAATSDKLCKCKATASESWSRSCFTSRLNGSWKPRQANAKQMQSKRKANAKQMQSKWKANAKQMQSKCKANAKQMQSKRKANAKQMQSKCKGKLCLDQCRTETTTVLGEKLNIQRGSLRTFCERCADSRLQQECQCGSQCPIPALITSDCQGENTAVAVVHHCRRWNLCAGSWHFNIFQP